MDYKEDFISWAHDCVRIEDKLTCRLVPFVPNRPQLRVISALEKMRRDGRPIRLILLKARQWGGSTLIQIYMAWQQLMRHTGWNSVICAHVKDASASIRGMYSRLLREYPDTLKTGKGKDWVLSPYEKSQGVVEIASRGCRITLASAAAPNSVRGSSYCMAHLSEVAFWGEGDNATAEEIVRTICGSVPRTADSLIVMESTANGKNNYFYHEWQRAVKGESDKTPVFVPWHEIEIYSRPVNEDERERLIASLDDYEMKLLENGVPLESIAWYHDKRREYPTHEAMMAEFPSTADEAFAASGRDAPFSEADLPELTMTHPAPQDPLVVAVASADPAERAVCLFDFRDGRCTAWPHTPCGSTLGSQLSAAEALCMRHDAPLAIAAAESQSCREIADALARRAADEGLVPLNDDDENPFLTLSDARIVELTDAHKEQRALGHILDADPECHTLYRDFRISRPQESPRVIARLAALSVMLGRADVITPADLPALCG